MFDYRSENLTFECFDADARKNQPMRTVERVSDPKFGLERCDYKLHVVELRLKRH